MTKTQRRRLGANLAIGQQLDVGMPVNTGPKVLKAEPSGPSLVPDDDAGNKLVTNSISLPESLWEELRDAANARRRQRGGRTSVSALIRELLEHHRPEWAPPEAGH